MDFKDNNDNELDIQALLDKYLPEEDEKEADLSDAGASAAADPNSVPAPVGRAVNNDFYMSGEPDASSDESGAPFEPESFEVSGREAQSADTIGENPAEANPGENADIPLFEKDGAPAESAVGENEEESRGASDDSFVFDEALIAELIAADDVQFGGVEGFEDLEDLSGFTVDEADGDVPEGGGEAEPDGDEPSAAEEAAQDDDPEEEIPIKERNTGDILNEDDYAEFVHASLDELDSDEATDTDINLIVAFGLEDELKAQVGAKKASKITKRFDSELKKSEEKEKKLLHDEYRTPAQTKEISEKYKKRYLSLKVKIGVCAVFALLLGLFENLPLIGYQVAGAFDPAVYPVVYVMTDLQLLLLCLAAAYEEIFEGFAGIFRGKLTPESILSVSALLSIVYSAVVARTAASPTEPTLFNFPIAFCAVMTLVYSYLTVKREIFSFNVISSKKPKYALRRLAPKDAALEVAAFSDSEEEMGDVLKIEKVSFIDGYFYRTESKNPSNSAVILMSLLLALALSCLFGGYAGIVGNGAAHAISMGYMAFTAAVPMSVMLTYAYPFYKANSSSYENDSTIVGENSLEEYSGASVISFEDNLVFPSVGVKVQNVKVYNNYRFDRVLYYAASVFTKTGGPLSDVFEIATLEMGYSDDVVLTGIGEGYIQTEVNGKSIMFGRAAELIELGVDIPAEIVNEDEDVDEDVSIMYMIFKGKIVAKMHIYYTLDSDFEYIVKQLAESGMSACVKTFDPNIDENMIKSKVKLDRYPMRVIKCSSLGDAFAECEHSDSGIVARGTSKALLRTVTYCDRVLDVKRTNSFLSLLATVITVVALAVVLLTDNISSVRSLMVVLCQLFWMIPMLISTKIAVK